ncbi:hypothetical protein [Spirochaeta cellobiosiphila]|uniref:hypothetical protein n=1 Tax=Spirochaeta cellobiosiphila TaxID=504483 RepID=UPI000419C7A0|nr:hypothetical protein [Spirochaeta cellobiosiphila]
MSLWDDVKERFSYGVRGSKRAISIAKEKAQDLGEKSVIHLELTQLRQDLDKTYKQLGKTVKSILMDQGRGSVSLKTAELKDLWTLIEDIEGNITIKEEHLNSDEKNDKMS